MLHETVKVDQGLVNSQDPSTLDPGEVIAADDCFYKPSDPALWKALGRVAFNSAALPNPMLAADFLKFADGSSLFLAEDRADLYTAPAGLTGSFSALGLGLSGTATMLDTIYNVRGDMYVVVNGVDRNRVIQKGPTTTFHGMLKNTNIPTVQVQGGALSGFVLSSGKSIQYWIEERVKDASGNIIRRNISVPVQITWGAAPQSYPFRAFFTTTFFTLAGGGGTVKPRVFRPSVVNSDATHWALFASSPTTVFPTGGELGEVAIGTQFIDDPRTGTDPSITGTPYDVIAVSLAGSTVTSPKWGPPPVATTGDIFEGCVVLNDVANPLYVQYSFFDEPQAFPPLFTIIIPAKKNDSIQVIKTLDNFCMVLCRESLWRINTLPKNDDGAFSVMRVTSEIEGAHGCVGPKAVAKFSFGQGPRIAYVSAYGIVVTDGHEWSILTSDFQWEENVEVSQLGNAVLVNHPRFYLLELRYTPKGGTRNTKKLFIHYHPSHAKAGGQYGTAEYRAKITGPINQDANDAFSLFLNGVSELFDANQDGRLYRCHTGNSEPVATGGIAMRVLTPDRYPGGIGGEATLRNLYVHHQAAPGQQATIRLVQRRPNKPDAVGAGTIALDRREATPFRLGGTAEAFQFGFENADTTGPVALDYFATVYGDVSPAESP